MEKRLKTQSAKSKPSPGPSPTGLGAPQFDLRTMLMVIGCICTILAVHVRFGALAASAVTLSILAVGAHIAANAIGTKLRDHRGNETARRGTTHADPQTPAALSEQDFAPTTRLSGRSQFGWLAVIVTAVGAAFSTAAGAGLFAIVLGESARWNLLLVGGLAFGVLGGIATFGGFSFMRVTSSALTQAVRERKK